MCKCTPEVRTPWCGKNGCEDPEGEPVNAVKFGCPCGITFFHECKHTLSKAEVAVDAAWERKD